MRTAGTTEDIMERITETDIDCIKPYEKNPRNNDKSIDKVANSIKEFGFLQPIVCDGAGVILAGHTRYAAAKKLGLRKVPVLYADGLTPEQARAYRLADNKAGEGSEWDEKLLIAELELLEAEKQLEDAGKEVRPSQQDHAALEMRVHVHELLQYRKEREDARRDQGGRFQHKAVCRQPLRLSREDPGRPSQGRRVVHLHDAEEAPCGRAPFCHGGLQGGGRRPGDPLL